MIAMVQNVRILLRHGTNKPAAVAVALHTRLQALLNPINARLKHQGGLYRHFVFMGTTSTKSNFHGATLC